MGTKPKAKGKRRPGRPATGVDPVMSLRLPAELVARINACVDAELFDSRSDAIRELLERGLATVEGGLADDEFG